MDKLLKFVTISILLVFLSGCGSLVENMMKDSGQSVQSDCGLGKGKVTKVVNMRNRALDPHYRKTKSLFHCSLMTL